MGDEGRGKHPSTPFVEITCLIFYFVSLKIFRIFLMSGRTTSFPALWRCCIDSHQHWQHKKFRDVDQILGRNVVCFVVARVQVVVLVVAGEHQPRGDGLFCIGRLQEYALLDGQNRYCLTVFTNVC